MNRRAIRSALFGALLVLCLLAPFHEARAQVAPSPAVRWEPPATVRNQDGRPICVAEAWLNWLESAPNPTSAPFADDALYRGAQFRDEIEGEAYTGTTARGGENVLRLYGLVGDVTYTKSWDEALQFLLTQGPILVSGPWYFGGDAANWSAWGEPFLARPVGEIRGFHLYECYAYADGKTTCRNSWGADWGDNGDFYARDEWFSVPAQTGLIDYVLAQKPPTGGGGGGGGGRAYMD